MKSIRPVFVILLAFLAFSCTSEKQRERTGSIVLGSWNVQALFDGTDDGNEYAEYRESSGWAEEKYRSRLNSITEAVKTMRFSMEAENGKPDILALLEVENSGICEELAVMLDYGWSFFAAAPSASLGLAVMSRFPIVNALTHSVQFGENRGPRPIAELALNVDGEILTFLICHWKSKLGGEKATERTRRAEASVAARLLAEHIDTPVIIMGDLNENHDEFFRSKNAYVCALMPDSEEAAAAGRTGAASPRPGFQDFLVLSGKRPPAADYFEGQNGAAVLYSPWLEEMDEDMERKGSFYYREQWETIDHVFLNGAMFDGTGWDFAGFRSAAGAPFTDTKGLPSVYIPRTGGGLSDHLPLLVRLERKPAYSQER